jgi:prepilin-type processing-associated H-X9-DG protein
MKTIRCHAIRAFSALELLFVIVTIALLAALLLPALAKSKARCGRINCVNNLKQVGLSFRCWSLDNGDRFPMQVSVTNGGTMELIGKGTSVHFLVMSNELNTPRVLICPNEVDGDRVIATTFSPTAPAGSQVPLTGDNNISYFVGVDATDGEPQMFLSGDRNLLVDGVPTRRGLVNLSTNQSVAWNKPRPNHNGGGNICLADGSVQQVKTDGLNRMLRRTGHATNRLSIP